MFRKPLCANCGQRKSAHHAVNRRCPTPDFTGFKQDSTYFPVGTDAKPEERSFPEQTPIIPDKQPAAVSIGPDFADILNTQIAKMLDAHPDINIRETFSIENPKAVTLEFSRK